jgi:hypothetical protein
MKDGRLLTGCIATHIISKEYDAIVIYHGRRSIDESQAKGWWADALEAKAATTKGEAMSKALITFGAVNCPTHGLVSITEDYYDDQMFLDDELWACPQCGATAEWVDQENMEDDYENYAAF